MTSLLLPHPIHHHLPVVLPFRVTDHSPEITR